MASALLEYFYTLVTCVLLFYFIRISREESHRSPFFLWFVFGFLFNLFSLSWLYTVYPLEWMPAGLLQLLGIATIHVLLALVAGISFSPVGFAFTKKTRTETKRLFLFAFLLAMGEVIRSFIFSALFLGNGATVGFHWSAGTIGNALSTTPFIEYAYIGGVYMLTFILGIIMYTITCWKRLNRRWSVLIGITFGLLFIHFVMPLQAPKKSMTVATINTNFATPVTEANATQEFAMRTKILRDTTLSFAKEQPSIIVYPEDARFLSHLEKQELVQINALFPHTLFIDGNTMREPSGLANVSIFYTPEQSHTVTLRKKAFLFPFSEYIPTLFTSLFHRFISSEALTTYEKTRTYSAAASMETYTYGDLTIGTIICSEILSHSTLNLLHEKHPNIIFYQSYLNVFHGNPWFLMEERSFSKIAAAQLRTPFIMSTNRAELYVISPFGSIVSASPVGFSTTTITIDNFAIGVK